MLIRCIHLNFCAGFAETDSQHTVIQKVVHGGILRQFAAAFLDVKL